MAGPLVVGIDLGTTHSCVAWTEGGGEIEVVPIDQLVPGGRERRLALPSVLYAPLGEEAIVDPFPSASGAFIVGELARSRGAEVPGRAITSAKSWLSHPELDPDTFTLPVGAPAGAPRLSPIDASARILRHLAHAFEASTRRRLADATVVLTLPASFDEGARAATLEAARRAELRVRLLEEPQAAFYDFMRAEGALAALLGKKKNEAFVLVVDVGGGTTDLSLARVDREDGDLTVTRVATGDHLLLGGDNMDLALAAVLRARLPEDVREGDSVADGQLVQRARVAKEALLADDAPESAAVPITLARGARLVGTTTTVRLSRREVRALVLDGFFPKLEEGPLPPRRVALVKRGLPYERDPAITRHVVRFLQRYADGRRPDAVLLNGGVFRASALGAALTASLRAWFGARVPVLAGTDPDLAVARGAARFGMLTATGAQRIRAGAPRSYYVGVAGPNGEPRAVCVVPRGTQEGVPCRLAGPTVKLRTGEPSRFDLYRARSGAVHAPGTVVDPTGKGFARLRPLITAARGTPGLVDVVLTGELTPVGTLDLGLREIGGAERTFGLAFQVRETREKKPGGAEPERARASDAASAEKAAATRARSPELRRAEALIAQAFSFAEKRSDATATISRRLEALLGDRLTWSLLDARDLHDALMSQRGARRWSAEHERAFWSLAGVTLRPGFGAPGDEARVRALFALFGQRMAFAERAPVAQAFYVAWRRIAPGLDGEAEASLFDALFPQLVAPRAPTAEVELRELLSWLERVSVERKIALGEAIVAKAASGLTGRALDDLARVAARVPVARGADARVVAPSVVEGWLARVSLADGRAQTAAAIVRMARVTDSAHDVSPKLRRKLASDLSARGIARDLVAPLLAHVAETPIDRSSRYGEALPPGLSID